ncbi:MAG TPA: DUF1727 domain-containing protein [Candidatus Sulfotelmatobacter sp.]|nr:DUF1727 domain-containing protein [Candidatus Sulfotelmatobacter sp.]
MAIDLRLTAAIAAGKLTAATSRRLRRGGGMTFPGNVTLALDGSALGKLGRSLPSGTVLVTGTNGKTTTTGLITAALQRSGMRVLSNHSGANIVFGLCAAAVADAGLDGRARSSIGIFEVDELWLERAVRELQPHLVVVLNFFRDQLDRSGELETAAARVGDALQRLPASAQVVFNSDDPQVVAQCLRSDAQLVPFGIDAEELVLARLPHIADARSCPRCGTNLHFSRIVLAHCGKYTCPGCGFKRLEPRFSVSRFDASTINLLRLAMNDGTELEASLGGVYNAYNIAAAYAACRSLGVAESDIARGIASFRPKFGRQETLSLHGRAMRFMLAKNPAGFDEVLRTADALGRTRTYLIAINDGIADGRDVSWLWDVDFERLATSPQRPLIVASGRRVEDLALRLKYAGMPAERVISVRDPAAALRRLAEVLPPGEEGVVIPTYTAMLELRAVAEREQAVTPFWVAPSIEMTEDVHAADGLTEDERAVSTQRTAG